MSARLTSVQRWRNRRSVEAASELIRTREYEVAAIPDDTTPKSFVATHHYAEACEVECRKRNIAQGAKPGPKVWVNGAVFDTILDERGTLRFPMNRIVDDLLDLGTGEGPPWRSALDMNKIAARDYSPEERREFYRLIGYSIGGYREVFPEDNVRVIRSRRR